MYPDPAPFIDYHDEGYVEREFDENEATALCGMLANQARAMLKCGKFSEQPLCGFI